VETGRPRGRARGPLRPGQLFCRREKSRAGGFLKIFEKTACFAGAKGKKRAFSAITVVKNAQKRP